MKLLLALLLTTAACKAAPPAPTKVNTMALGPIGDVDFTKRLPDKVKVPAEQKEFEGTRTICKGPGHTGADIKVRWHTFMDGKDTYFGTAHFDLVRVEEGIEVALSDQKPMLGASSYQPGKPYQALAQVWFTCKQPGVEAGSDKGGLVAFDTEGNVMNTSVE